MEINPNFTCCYCGKTAAEKDEEIIVVHHVGYVACGDDGDVCLEADEDFAHTSCEKESLAAGRRIHRNFERQMRRAMRKGKPLDPSDPFSENYMPRR